LTTLHFRNGPNGETSYVNITLDGCMFPSLKLVQFITLSEKLII